MKNSQIPNLLVFLVLRENLPFFANLCHPFLRWELFDFNIVQHLLGKQAISARWRLLRTSHVLVQDPLVILRQEILMLRSYVSGILRHEFRDFLLIITVIVVGLFDPFGLLLQLHVLPLLATLLSVALPVKIGIAGVGVHLLLEKEVEGFGRFLGRAGISRIHLLHRGLRLRRLRLQHGLSRRRRSGLDRLLLGLHLRL